MSEKFHQVTPLFWYINADANGTVALPNPAASGGPVAPIGLQIAVLDNMGLAATTNITITGPINGGTTGTSLTTNYAWALFIWSGATWMQLGPAV